MSVPEQSLRITITAIDAFSPMFERLQVALTALQDSAAKFGEAFQVAFSEAASALGRLDEATVPAQAAIADLATEADAAATTVDGATATMMAGFDKVLASVDETTIAIDQMAVVAEEAGVAVAGATASAGGGGGAGAGAGAGGGAAAGGGFLSGLKSMGTAATTVGRDLTMALTVPIVGIGAVSLVMANRFQAAMEQIRTQAGGTQQEVDNMSAAVLAMAGTVPQGPQVLAEALFHLESLGLRGQAALDALRISAEGAAVGGANLTDVTNALGSAVVSGIGGVQDINQAMGTLNAIVGAGNMHMQDLAAAMSSKILPAAASAGLSLTSIGAAIATFTDTGVPATQAANNLRTSIGMMEAPSGPAIKALKSIGMSATQMAEDMRSGGILKAVDDLKTHLEAAGLTATQQTTIIAEAFGKSRSAAAMETLVNESDRLAQRTAQITAQAGDFSAAWAAAQKTSAVQWGEFVSLVSAAAITIGQDLQPAFERLLRALMPIVAWIKNLADKFKELSPANQAMVLDLGLLAAAIGPLLLLVGAFALAIVAITAPGMAVIGVLVGLAAIAVVVVTHWKQIKQWTEDTFGAPFAAIMHAVQSVVQSVWGVIGPFITSVVNEVKGAMQTAWPEIQQIVTTVWSAIVEVVRLAAAIIGPFVKQFLKTLEDDWRTAWKLVGDVLKTAWDVISGAFKVALDVFLAILMPILDLLTGHWKKAWDDLKHYMGQALQDAWDMAKKLLGDLGKLFTDFGKGVLQDLKDTFGAIPRLIGQAMQDAEAALPGWAKGMLGITGGAGAGSITPAAAGGGNTTVTVNVAGSVTSEKNLAATVANHLGGMIKTRSKYAT